MDNPDRREREKQRREEEILDAAERVFFRKGFENASMDEIAREAQFTKPTLYQYFRDKENLYLKVSLRGFILFRDTVFSASDEHLSAIDALLSMSSKLLEFSRTHPDHCKLFGALSRVRPGQDGDTPARAELSAFNDSLFESLSRLIGRGQSEGSIPATLDPVKTAYSLIFLLTGFLNQLAMTGRTFTGHFSLDYERFASDTTELLLRGLRLAPDAAKK
jgi:AcrR family transcriptional regulator